MTNNGTPSYQLAQAIAAVVADFRAEDPDRAGLTDAEIVAETRYELDDDAIAVLVEGGDMGEDLADAYRAVFDATPENLDALTGAVYEDGAERDSTGDAGVGDEVPGRLTRYGDPGEPDLADDLADPVDPTAPGFVVLDDQTLARMREALDAGDTAEADRIFDSAPPYVPGPT